MDNCLVCEEMGIKDCINCYLGNPCLGCQDYDKNTNTCTSNGACGDDKRKEG